MTGLPGATQALQHVRRSAARVFAVLEADDPVVDPDRPGAGPVPPGHRGHRAPGRPLPRRRGPGPGRRRPGARVRDAGWPWSGRAGPASRPWPRCWRASWPTSGSATLGGTELLRPGRRRGALGRRDGDPRRPPLRHHLGREPAHRPPRAPPTPTWPPWWNGSAWPAGWPGCPTGWGPRWATPVPACRAASASGWRWPGPCWPTSRSSSSTSRPSTWTRWRRTGLPPTSWP